MNCKSFLEDKDYVAAMRKGGSLRNKAIDCLYRSFKDQVVRSLQNYVGYYSGQRDDVRDLSQDAFIILTNKIETGGYKDGSLIHFWIGIAKGLLKNKVRRDARMDLVDDTLKFDGESIESPETELLLAEKKELVDRLLDTVGEKCKQVLMMWAHGFSMTEIADKLAMSSEAIARKTKFKCKSKLMSKLKDTDIDVWY